jgi:hypothetical protein
MDGIKRAIVDMQNPFFYEFYPWFYQMFCVSLIRHHTYCFLCLKDTYWYNKLLFMCRRQREGDWGIEYRAWGIEHGAFSPPAKAKMRNDDTCFIFAFWFLKTHPTDTNNQVISSTNNPPPISDVQGISQTARWRAQQAELILGRPIFSGKSWLKDNDSGFFFHALNQRLQMLVDGFFDQLG